MLKLNDKVMYGSTGVCTVERIEEKEISREVKTYYVLKPVSQNSSTVFLPADNEKLLSKVRKVLSKEEISCIICELKNAEDIWVDSDAERRVAFSEIISSGDRKKSMLLLKSLMNRRADLMTKGKRLHIADERALKEAGRLSYDEMSEALGLSVAEAEEYFKRELIG